MARGKETGIWNGQSALVGWGGVRCRFLTLIAVLLLAFSLSALAMAPAPAQAASFKDVPSGQWYTSWVDKASDQGLMSGFTDPATGRPTGYFGPDEPLTRAQVATVLWRMAGGPSSGHASFPDVERGSWYDAPVAWCVKAGVVTGYTSGPDRGYFRPDRPVTRQELATMVWRYAKHAGMDVADPDPAAFESTTDWRTVDTWASEALTWTAAAGVLSGVDNHDGTYSVVPFGTATRAMAAKVFVVLSGSPSAAKASHTVTFDSNGGSAVKAQTVKNGAKASKPASPTKSGYTFKGWYSDKSLTKAYDFNSTVRSNLTLYAKWEKKATYTVTFNSNGGSAVKAQSVSSGARASKPANPTKAGYAFKGWYSDKSLTKAYDFTSAVKSNLTLHAKWTAESQSYAVLYKDGLLSLQAGADTDPSHGKVLGKWAWDGSSQPWYDQRDRVKSVVARDRVAVSNGSKMFSGLSNCTSMDLSRLDASHATSFSFMFQGCSSLTTVDVSGWDVSGVQDFCQMFSGCSSLTTLDLSGWDVSSATDFSSMFQFCSSLESLDLTGWNPSSATSLGRMFQNCSALASLSLSDWDVSSVADFGWMFANCKSLASFDVSGWDVSGAKDFAYMFAGCRSLESLDLSTWKTGALEGATSMFTACASLKSLDLSGWDVSNCASVDYMFSNCSSLDSVTLGAGCGPLVEKLPSGPWYDAEGKQYDYPPAGVAGTFTKTKPATLTVADADASLPAQIAEGEKDGLRYVVVSEGASFEYGLEYSELAGRYVGPGAYLTGYAGEGDSLVVPLEVEGIPVVSANLSWNEFDRVGMTRLASISFERVEGKASSLTQLDVSGNGLSSLDIEGLDALVRLNCEGNPIADLAALQAWAAQDGHEAKLPQAQDAAPTEPGDAAAPSEPSAPEPPSEPDTPAVEPGEPSEPEAPSEPAEPEVPSEPEAPSEPETPSEPEEPSVEPSPAEDPSDDPAASDEANPASDSLELGEDPVPALAA